MSRLQTSIIYLCIFLSGISIGSTVGIKFANSSKPLHFEAGVAAGVLSYLKIKSGEIDCGGKEKIMDCVYENAKITYEEIGGGE